MQLRCNPRPLPRQFASHPKASGIVYEKDLKIGSSRLRAKLLVFKNQRHLHLFWQNVLGHRLGRFCKGAVNSLIQEVQYFGKYEKALSCRHLEADGRYFCVIGLIQTWMTVEVMTHEATHAAFCYVKRVRRSPWDVQSKDFHEEEVCYPAGKIASELTTAFWKVRELKQALPLP